ncbi:MAG: hypothetical protein ACKVX7_13515 [Planctomycetota bacterium]
MYFESLSALLRRVVFFILVFGALTLFCRPDQNFSESSLTYFDVKSTRLPDGTFRIDGPGGPRIVNSHEEVVETMVAMGSADKRARAEHYNTVYAQNRWRRFLRNVWIGGSLSLIYFCFLRRPPLLSELHDRNSETRTRPPKALTSPTEPQPNPLGKMFDVSSADERPPNPP